MLSLTRLKWTFACLYFVQGGAISYFTLFQKPYLNQLGINRSSIALLSTLMLVPFVLKIFFGFISDRFAHPQWGKRLPYMIGGLTCAASFFFLTSLFPASNALTIYSFLVLGASFSIAFFDAATDGLAIDLVSAKDQGSVQSFMVGGKAIGVILLSQSIGHLVELKGYSFVFLSIACIFLIPLFLCIKLKRHINLELNETDRKVPSIKIREIKVLLILLALYGITYSFISFGSDGLITLFLSEVYELKESQIGSYGSIRGIGAIAGSLLAGLVLNRAKQSDFKVHLGSLLFLALGALIIGAGMDESTYKTIAFFWGGIWAFQEVCFLTLVMARLTGSQSAFAFATLMAMANLGTAIGEAVLTELSAKFDYQALFYCLALAILFPITLLIIIFRNSRSTVPSSAPAL